MSKPLHIWHVKKAYVVVSLQGVPVAFYDTWGPADDERRRRDDTLQKLNAVLAEDGYWSNGNGS